MTLATNLLFVPNHVLGAIMLTVGALLLLDGYRIWKAGLREDRPLDSAVFGLRLRVELFYGTGAALAGIGAVTALGPPGATWGHSHSKT